MRFLIKFVISVIAVMVVTMLLPGTTIVGGWVAAILAAAVIGLLNTIVKPVLKILTLPITVLTLGLFLLVINALMILAADWLLGVSFEVANFWWALLFSLIYSLVVYIMEEIAEKITGKEYN